MVAVEVEAGWGIARTARPFTQAGWDLAEETGGSNILWKNGHFPELIERAYKGSEQIQNVKVLKSVRKTQMYLQRKYSQTVLSATPEARWQME